VFTWEEFKKKFRDAHVPESVVELKKREFDELQQNTAPIMQYVRDFNRLSRYAPEEVNSDEKRKKRFMKGMNPYMKMQLWLARTAEFQELIDAAITFEDDYRKVQEERKKRACIEPRKYIVAKPTPDRSFKPRFRLVGNNSNRETTTILVRISSATTVVCVDIICPSARSPRSSVMEVEGRVI
jgi:hypothetical protein